jgi:hypothetical protein
MASDSFTALATRLKDLDDLLGAHDAVTVAHAANPGRRFNVMGLNRGATTEEPTRTIAPAAPAEPITSRLSTAITVRGRWSAVKVHSCSHE